MAEASNWEIERPAAVSAEMLGVRQAVEFFARHFLLIIGGLCIGIALGLVIQKITPTAYESRGKFVVDELPFGKQGSDTLDAETERQLVQTLILSIASRDMAAAVAKQLGIPKERLAFEEIDIPLKLKGRTPEANIEVTATKDSRIGVITATSQSAEFAAKVVNAILSQLQLYNEIGGRLQQIRFNLNLARTKADSIQAQLVTVSGLRITHEQQNTELAAYMARGLPLESFTAFSSDTTLNNLKTQLILVKSEYESIAATNTLGPRLAGKRSELTGLKTQLSHHAESLAGGMKSELEILTTREQDLKEELANAQAQIQKLNDTAGRLVQSYGDPAAMRGILDDAPDQTASTGNVVVVIDKAVPSKKAARPKLMFNLAIGIILGGMLGIGGAGLRALLDNRLHSPAMVEEKTGLPCLAMLPPLDRVENRKNIFERPRSPIGMGYLRSHLLRTVMETKSRQIIGFSPVTRNGDASRLVAGLAILLAQAERRTLVIDLHRRPPRIASMLAVEHGDGLSKWLAADQPLDGYIGYTTIRELGVLGFGKVGPDLDDMLGRRPPAAAIEGLLKDWDFILINSPAIRFDWTAMLTLPPESPLLIAADYRQSKATDVTSTAQRARASHWAIEGIVLMNCPRRVAGVKSL
jgi:uncharacterized protein involved in exopolysaccharide biosynthesis/Mrp family chromosome partitioning ATPase